MTTTAPRVEPPREWNFPIPERFRLDNGLSVCLYHLPGQHVISAIMVLDIPLSAEDPFLEGEATICARTIDEGTRTHPGEEFAERLESEGAEISVVQGLSGVQAMLDVPASRLAAALPLLAETLAEPQLTDADIDRHVALRLDEIQQVRANSAQLASVTFRSIVFNRTHRASRMNGGEPETVANITGEAVRRFHARYYGPRDATLVLAGQLPENTPELVERCLGGWRNAQQAAVAHFAAPPAPMVTKFLERDSVQADLRLGGFGIDRHDARWPDLQVATHAIGGAFLSRLNKALREERGYTYGVSLRTAPLRDGGSFAVSGSFRNEVIAESIDEARHLLDISIKPVTKNEVEAAVNYYIGASPLRYATAEGVAEQAAGQVLNNLPDDYLTVFHSGLREVTPSSATEAYQAIVRPEALSLVVVGDVSRLRH